MAADFYDAFNTGLSDFYARTGETWTLVKTGTSFPALAIDRDSATSQSMSGGQYVNVHTLVFLTQDVFLTSGVAKGDIITTERDATRYAVLEIDHDGDASRTLLCGPAQINVVWK